MKFNDRLFGDISKVAGGAATLLTGMRDHVEQRRGGYSSSESISRAEFEAVRDMAAKAREVQDALERRIAALEAERNGAKS
jgi:BMFP domain-containing protein YqiC